MSSLYVSGKEDLYPLLQNTRGTLHTDRYLDTNPTGWDYRSCSGLKVHSLKWFVSQTAHGYHVLLWKVYLRKLARVFKLLCVNLYHQYFNSLHRILQSTRFNVTRTLSLNIIMMHVIVWFTSHLVDETLLVNVNIVNCDLYWSLIVDQCLWVSVRVNCNQYHCK